MKHQALISKFVLLAFCLSACTSISVKPVSNAEHISHICIQHNPKVEVQDFVTVLQKRLAYHGIQSQVVQTSTDANCSYLMTYTALRSWDFTAFLSHAELTLKKDGKEIGSATYHLNGKGGLSFSKFDSVETKMNPVIDQLIGNKKATTQTMPSTSHQPSVIPTSPVVPEERPLLPI